MVVGLLSPINRLPTWFVQHAFSNWHHKLSCLLLVWSQIPNVNPYEPSYKNDLRSVWKATSYQTLFCLMVVSLSLFQNAVQIICIEMSSRSGDKHSILMLTGVSEDASAAITYVLEHGHVSEAQSLRNNKHLNVECHGQNRDWSWKHVSCSLTWDTQRRRELLGLSITSVRCGL